MPHSWFDAYQFGSHAVDWLLLLAAVLVAIGLEISARGEVRR